MNSKNIVAIKEDKVRCTCVKCLKEHDKEHLHIIHIPSMGYGSGFDGFSTLFVLCDDCYNESIKDNKELWSMKTKTYVVHYKKNDDIPNEERKTSERISKNDYEVPIDMINGVIYSADFDETYEDYKYENEMFDYIHNLPLAGKEIVYNRLNRGRRDYKHDPQEWIDYELGELSHERCKANHWVSPDEIKAYREKYEKCHHVIDVVYSDRSGGSHCLLNPIVRGKRGGKCGGSYGCYKCEYFKERIGELRVVKHEGEIGLNKKDNIDILSAKEKQEVGMKPKYTLKRLSVFYYLENDEILEGVALKVEKDKVLTVKRKDMQDVLHNRKESKDITYKWIDIKCYVDFIAQLVDEREKEIVAIEKEGRLA